MLLVRTGSHELDVVRVADANPHVLIRTLGQASRSDRIKAGLIVWDATGITTLFLHGLRDETLD